MRRILDTVRTFFTGKSRTAGAQLFAAFVFVVPWAPPILGSNFSKDFLFQVGKALARLRLPQLLLDRTDLRVERT
jgi:hypothetical protein